MYVVGDGPLPTSHPQREDHATTSWRTWRDPHAMVRAPHAWCTGRGLALRVMQPVYAGGATESRPCTPNLSIKLATKPLALASSTNAVSQTYAASLPLLIPIACCTDANWPSRMREPGNFPARSTRPGRRPAKASILPLTNCANAASPPSMALSSACLILFSSHNPYALPLDTEMRLPGRSTSAID